MKRYPGIRPFRTDEQHLFFGRDTDTERLLRLIDLQQVVILYGKSGYGKSSLLSAGVFPRLQADGQLQPWEIRLGPYKPGESLPPAENLRLAVGRRLSEHPILPASLAEPSLWQSLKNLQTPVNKRFLLVFDQFEELFTYPQEQILEFKKQLAEALFSIVPKRYEKALASAKLPPETEDAIYTPFELKVVFSIRADRMSLLNGLKDYLPNLLQHGYELDALDEASAKEAILSPAKLPNIEFDTLPFVFTPDALTAIFAALRDERGRIETSTLQIVCKHVEDNIVAKRYAVDSSTDLTIMKKSGLSNFEPVITIHATDLGDISAIFGDFYENTLAALPYAERQSTRFLIEQVLIKDGIRMPYAEQALLALPGTGIHPILKEGELPANLLTTDQLQRLTAASLLRVERDDQGRMIYEVGHDTLVRPIEEAAKARRDAAKKDFEEMRLNAEAERQRQERKKIEAGRRRNILVGLFALGLLGFAFYQNLEARKAKKEAEAMTTLAKEKTELANQKDSLANSAQSRADTLLISVNAAKTRIEQAEKDLNLAKNDTEAAKRKAQKNLEEAEKAGLRVVIFSCDYARLQIKSMDYVLAAELLHPTIDLVMNRPKGSSLDEYRKVVAILLMESAFWFVETNEPEYARKEMAHVARLMGNNLPGLNDPALGEKTEKTRSRLAEMLKGLHPKHYSILYDQYFGYFAQIPGGTDTIGNEDVGQLIVTVSPFRLAYTETTWWQYNLFCLATGYPQPEKPGWGSDGDNPVVNVSWYDAVVYANWRSQREGLRPAYTIKDSLGRSQDEGWEVEFDSTANGFRLPTEAEWEYAARAGTEFEYAGDSLLEKVGWFYKNSGSRTHPVAQKMPNGFGLYDMSANVWEWCYDWYGNYPEGPVKDYRGPDKGSSRVLRGGSWLSGAGSARVDFRYGNSPFSRDFLYGFRLARAVTL